MKRKTKRITGASLWRLVSHWRKYRWSTIRTTSASPMTKWSSYEIQNYYFEISLHIDECLTDPCLNNGTCYNKPGSYECKCTSGYDSDNCGNGETLRTINNYWMRLSMISCFTASADNTDLDFDNSWYHELSKPRVCVITDCDNTDLGDNTDLCDDTDLGFDHSCAVNYQNRGLCYLPKPKAEADNTDTRFW